MSKLCFATYPSIRTVQKEPELYWLIERLLASKVQSLLSIGLLDAGTEWHIARVYRECGRDIAITGVDINDSRELQKNIAEIGSLWNQSFRLLRQSSHDEFSELGTFDAVWIDGDHSYKGVKQDFALAATKATKLIALHDIADTKYHRKMKCFVSKLWAEIKLSGLRTEEMLESDWAGIGIVHLGDL